MPSSRTRVARPAWLAIFMDSSCRGLRSVRVRLRWRWVPRTGARCPPATSGAPTPAARLGEVEALDAGVDRLRRLSDAVPSAVRPVLAGEWLGHALHPALTDLPI